mmetsp:Transcript_46645/g.129774  ORF Transcript_46645/g.129774 Transcript_46645/m.129774 type:complete len:432 (-) Transcript_46645:89-1384(-)|eukprot:CAMPEP_0179057716 /NCGR_PEP_ID=MMETSP0796-20121207/24477_1 /TAXON_ID=73915 /ORGANISM="Pyrodinium bahamense, Strain pbaha01" /LENGTH=431 /DNA_ID=CAMNT_0020754443 /DNA_START=71 /DNA_END=1366 /DNA_ORIENTATION=+
MAYSYTSAGGSKVTVPCRVDKQEALPVTKASFREQVRDPSRQQRALLHLRYDLHWHLLENGRDRWTSKDGNAYVVDPADPFFLALVGDTRGVVKLCRENRALVQQGDRNGSGATLLYYACRAGFRDLVDALLVLGAPVSNVGPCGSAPLHAASFYGHAIVVSALLARGADRAIKNRYGNTAQMEARTPEIRAMLADDVINAHLKPLVDAGVGESLRRVALPGQDRVIAWKVSRPAALVQEDLIATARVPTDWLHAWHGTKPQYMESILRTGLRPAGSCGIKPPSGHIPLGRTVFGIKDFAAAVFVSPDLAYSSHPAYAGRITAGGEEWLTLMLARVRPGSFQTFRSTVGGYIPVNESVEPEWRIVTELPGHCNPEDLEGHPTTDGADMFRISSRDDSHTNCVVTDVILLSKEFLDSGTLPREQAAAILVSA